MKQHIFHPERYASIGHQLTFLVVTVTILCILLYRPIVEFHPVGKEPIIQPVTEQVTTQWGKKPAHVNVGMHITDFLKFDTIKNEFVINAFIWFVFDPEVVSLEMVDKFAFTKGEILQKHPMSVKKMDKSTVALYSIRVQFSTILDYARFPIDDHRIFLNLTHQSATADELVYDADIRNFIISKNIYISGWEVVGRHVASGYAPVPLGDNNTMLQNKTVFSLDLSKSDLRQLSIILLPLLFLFYLGLFTFSIRDITIAMTLPLASVGSLFAYSLVIQVISPLVGYMMISDYLFIFFLFTSFIILFVKALVAVPETMLSRPALKRIEGITIVGLQIALIIIWYILLDIRDV